jgi:uncharacterized damage-inducible protein DinB
VIAGAGGQESLHFAFILGHMSADKQTLADLVRYSAWASKKLIAFAAAVPEQDSVRVIPNSHGGILKTFQHIYYADRVWLARLEYASIAQFEDPAPGPSFADLNNSWRMLLDRMVAYVEGAEPTTKVTFQRLTGDTYSIETYKIVQHVVNHGTYHRGQIAAMLKQSGHTPPSTDLLFYELGM